MLSSLMLAKLTAPAIVVALSPIPIVVSLVLLVHHERPYVSSIAYVGGRLVSLAALTTAFMVVPGLFDGLRGPGPPWADWVVMGAGAAIAAWGLWLWWGRPVGEPRSDPAVGRATPVVALSLGLFPVLANPKVLAATAAVGTQLAAAHCAGTNAMIAVAYFTLLANATAAAPIVAYRVGGPGIEQRLERIRRWIHGRQRAITTLTLVTAGVAVVLYGAS